MHRPDDFELIVVNNASTDNTAAVIENFATNAGYSVKLACESTLGLGNARNCGWQHAQGDIIAFTDDDCYVDPSYAEDILKIFSVDHRLGYIGGRILLFDPTDLPITIKESNVREKFEPGIFIPAGKIQGANFAFRRQALEDAGGFDPLLGAGTPFPAEDIEMLGRLSAMGWYGLYTPEPVVFHHHGRKTEEAAKKLYRGYDLGRGAYYMAMLLKPRFGIRLRTLRYWFYFIRHQSIIRTIRELRGALGYLSAKSKRLFNNLLHGYFKRS